MTRINVVDVKTLHFKHLLAEYKEITRPLKKVRNRQKKGRLRRMLILQMIMYSEKATKISFLLG